MLHRTTACLETGSRRLLRGPRPATQHTQRALHSAFWHHGGGDIDLPSWWASILQSPTVTATGERADSYEAKPRLDTTLSTRGGKDEIFLDFLYPEKTMILLQRLSRLGQETGEGRRADILLPQHGRPFSSTRALPEDKETSSENIETEASNNRETPTEGSKEKVSDQSDALTGATAGPDRQFQSLKEEEDFYRTSFERAASEQDWDLAGSIYQKFFDHQQANAHITRSFWTRKMLRVSDTYNVAASLVKYAERQVKKDEKNRKRIVLFVSRCFTALFSHDSLRPWYYAVSLLERLDHNGLTERYLFENLLLTQVELPANRQLSQRSNQMGALYQAYRNSQCFQPSRGLLRKLIVRASKCEETHSPVKALSTKLLIKDFIGIYGELDIKSYAILLHSWARKGDLEKLHEYTRKLVEQFPQDVTIDFLYPLLNIHARRGQLKETRTQFDLLPEKYGFQPDLACWNILLNAHAMADDPIGASAVFNEMADHGVAPDQYTIGPLLNVYAERGDVDGVEQILSIAEEKKIPLTPPMIGSQVLAYIRTEDMVEAERIVDQALELCHKEKWPLGSLTGVWNHVITAYALQRDERSALQAFKRMEKAGVKADGLTYAALMQALAVQRRTSEAHSMMRKVLPAKRVSITSFHYALIIYGYTQEGKFDAALAAHKAMTDKGLRPTLSTQALILKIKTALERKHVTEELGLETRMEHIRLVESEAILQDLLESSKPEGLSQAYPKTGLGPTPLDQAYPAKYFEHIIESYGATRAYQQAERMLEQFNRRKGGTTGAPLGILRSLMVAYINANEHESIDKCWALALDTARNLAQLGPRPASMLGPSKSPSNEAPDDDPAKDDDGFGYTHWMVEDDGGLINDKDKDKANDNDIDIDTDIDTDNNNNSSTASARVAKINKLAVARRDLVSKCFYYYADSLDRRGKHATMVSTTSSLLAEGFQLDNRTWNLIVQALARSGDLMQAFIYCEAHLMPGWFGWKDRLTNTNPLLYRGPQQLMKFNPNSLQPKAVYPRYRTLVMLAAALRGTRGDGAGGAGVDGAGHGEQVDDDDSGSGDGGATDRAARATSAAAADELVSIAPKTVDAIRSMPRVDDKLQRKFFGDRA